MPAVARHKTALRRIDLSRPVRLAIDDGILAATAAFFDYGCGHGADIRLLTARGFKADGWDPIHRPRAEKQSADVVNIGYVINVIEDAAERATTLREAWTLTHGVLIIAARLTLDADASRFARYEDGCLTRTGTFQKFYEQDELRAFVDETLNTVSIAAAPGVFYAFKDDAQRQSFAASRYRRRIAVPRLRRSELLFEEHRALLDPLLAFLAQRGRLPGPTELDPDPICTVFGSLRRAFSVISRVTAPDEWERIRDQLSEDLLVYLALQRFGRRPTFAELATDLQLDAKAFFGSYTRACALADILLFSTGNPAALDEALRTANIGKLTGNARYVHRDFIERLPPILRVFEGCARALVGAVEGANIVKLHRGKPLVSYLAYPSFDTEAHPALHASLVVPLQTSRLEWRSYEAAANPPILHRKEELITSDDPRFERFEKLTKQEERWGLFENPAAIGTRDGWNAVLRAKAVRIRGHSVRRQAAPPKSAPGQSAQ